MNDRCAASSMPPVLHRVAHCHRRSAHAGADTFKCSWCLSAGKAQAAAPPPWAPSPAMACQTVCLPPPQHTTEDSVRLFTEQASIAVSPEPSDDPSNFSGLLLVLQLHQIQCCAVHDRHKGQQSLGLGCHPGWWQLELLHSIALSCMADGQPHAALWPLLASAQLRRD